MYYYILHGKVLAEVVQKCTHHDGFIKLANRFRSDDYVRLFNCW